MKRDTSDKYEPVLWDRSIRRTPSGFVLTLRADGEVTTIRKHTLLEAQAVMDLFPDEVYLGHEVPYSVFYPGSECA